MEALILYFVLFFSGFSAFSAPDLAIETIPFSAMRELGRTLTYTIPSLALLWYLLSDKRGFSALEDEKPRIGDLIPFAIGFPGLLGIGIGVSFLVTLFSARSGMPPPPKVEAPAGMVGYTVMAASCLGTGYLEETYFRYYLLTKFENYLPYPLFGILLSTIMFSACHLYEGPWGIINSALAGILLSFLFIRYRSLHGIAWAHSAYNIMVYIMGNYIS